MLGLDDQLGRPLEQDPLARRKLGDELVGIFTADGTRGCQQADATTTGKRGCGLDGGYHTDDRYSHGRTQGRQSDGAGRVAGNHHQIDGMLDHHVADQPGAGFGEGGLAQLTIGEVGIIKTIEVVVCRQCAADLAVDGQPTHTGVEHENIGHLSSPLVQVGDHTPADRQ
ncbi:hypothetical protein RY45_00635 [Aeromonas hydrophila]|nr:hypothetical protein RY45_00635 [Aeromonas hydrophila]